jgi:hypothetical protein
MRGFNRIKTNAWDLGSFALDSGRRVGPTIVAQKTVESRQWRVR